MHPMLLTALQLMAGGCSLLNKVFLSLDERARHRRDAAWSRRWQIWTWAIYIASVPAWTVLYAYWHKWMAVVMEVVGLPGMFFGLGIALRGVNDKPPGWLDRLSLLCIPVGLICNIYDIGWPKNWGLGQLFEFVMVAGFLVGTRLIAKKRPSGYICYGIMHLSCGALMYLQHSYWLLGQQVLSLLLMVYAFATQRRTALAIASG